MRSNVEKKKRLSIEIISTTTVAQSLKSDNFTDSEREKSIQ